MPGALKLPAPPPPAWARSPQTSQELAQFIFAIHFDWMATIYRNRACPNPSFIRFRYFQSGIGRIWWRWLWGGRARWSLGSRRRTLWSRCSRRGARSSSSYGMPRLSRVPTWGGSKGGREDPLHELDAHERRWGSQLPNAGDPEESTADRSSGLALSPVCGTVYSPLSTIQFTLSYQRFMFSFLIIAVICRTRISRGRCSALPRWNMCSNPRISGLSTYLHHWPGSRAK